MKKLFCRALISAVNKKEAEKIASALVSKKLVAGAHLTKGQSVYWWNNKIVEKEYYNVSVFSLAKNKQRIIREVEKLHSDECPVIAFFEMDGNRAFLDWIRESTDAKKGK
ncbi:MAG: divalent cation tolerance protein CutA [Candidatus Micrarchaeia archaeon]